VSAVPRPGGHDDGRIVRLLHASDLHVGDSISSDSIGPLMAAAVAHGADAVVLVGDIFDHNRVPTDIAQGFADELGECGRPVVVLPGNHDCLVPESVWRRVTLPANVHVIMDEEGEHVALDDLDVDLWGRPHITHGDLRPLTDIPPRQSRTWQVALAHGHMVLGPDDLHRSYQITPEEIAASDRDYVALGHWDVPRDMSAGDVTAHYSGSATRFGVCALVTLETTPEGKRTVDVQKVELGG
jgi:DNA repair exonuclease SbcCD nuclease subunit